MSVADWVLAVDFGTTSTAAAIRIDGTTQRVAIDGALSMPSMVFWREGTGSPGTGRLVLGQDADEGLGLAPWCVERTPKRRIADDVIVLGEHGQVELRVTDVIGQILAKVISEATLQRSGQRPAELRLTHPARWGQLRLGKLREAAAIAGFDSPVLIPEPVAAATHFASERLTVGQHVAVYDLGGGTFDTAVLQRTEDSFALAGPPGGIEQLGGEDFDFRLYQRLGSELADDQWKALQAPTDRVWTQANRELLRNARRTKEALSRNPDYEFLLGYPIDRTLVVTAEGFQELIADSITETVQELARTIRSAGLKPTDLAAVYLAGGSSKIPLIKQTIEQQLGQTPESLDDPKAVTALGAARVARASGEDRAPAAPAAPGTAPGTGPVPISNGHSATVVGETVLDPQPTLEPQPEPQSSQPTVLEQMPPAATAAAVGEPATSEVPPAVHEPEPAWRERPPAEPLAPPQPLAPAEPLAPPPRRAASPIWRFAQPLMIAGSVALVGDTFLKWDQNNFWKSVPSIHLKVALGVAWAATLVLSAITVSRRPGVLSRLAGAAGLFTAGGVIAWPILYTSFHPIGVGVYLGLVIAIVIGLGGLIAALQPAPGMDAHKSPIGWLLRVPGAPVMFAGCLGLAGVSFLHVLFGFNFWKLERSLHLKIALGGFVVAALVLSLLAVARWTGFWSRFAGAAGLFAAGSVFFSLVYFTSYPKIGIATYLGLALSLAVAIGGLSALLVADSDREPAAPPAAPG